MPDADSIDAGRVDAGAVDAGSSPADAGPIDEAMQDAATADAGAEADDGGPVDAGDTDAGVLEVDAGPDDAGEPVVEMRLIPAGDFWRGCNGTIDSLCSADEGTGGQVSLSAFEIDATEVTQGAYARCVAEGPCSSAHPSSAQCPYAPTVSPQRPVVCVDWNDAQTYCSWMGKRLPTEAEWEKAARGTDGRLYPWGNDAPDCTRTNLFGCSNQPQEVGTHTGDSPFGVHDMAGNVWEWVADWYLPDYYGSAPLQDPPGPSAQPANGRVGRGGGFEMLAHHTPPDFLRTSFRHPIDPNIYRIGIGFRCARSVP